jgi:hypothetical protein
MDFGATSQKERGERETEGDIETEGRKRGKKKIWRKNKYRQDEKEKRAVSVEMEVKERIKREGRQLEGRGREDKDRRKKERKKERKER